MIWSWPAAQSGGNPVSIIYMENKQADAGRDGRTRLARLNSQVRSGTENVVQLTTNSRTRLATLLSG